MHHWSISPWKDAQGWGCCTEVPSLLSKCAATPAQKEKSLLLLIKVMPINLKTWCHFIFRKLFFKKNCKGRYGEMKSLYIAGGNIKWHRFHERQTLEWAQDPGSHHTSSCMFKELKGGAGQTRANKSSLLHSSWTEKWQEDQNFKAKLGYTVRSRSAWAMWDPDARDPTHSFVRATNWAATSSLWPFFFKGYLNKPIWRLQFWRGG